MAERIGSAVNNISHARQILDETLVYAKERKAFGTPIGSFQANKFTLAELQTLAEVTQAFVDQCVMEAVHGTLTAVDAAKAKWWSAQAQNDILDSCLQLWGGYGYMNEYHVARGWADARASKIWAGSERDHEGAHRPRHGIVIMRAVRPRRPRSSHRGCCARTPIGRAVKGSLTQVRPDDLAAGVITAALAKVDALDARTLDDIYVGCAEPRDEQGGNMARRIAVQLGLDNVSAATINRFCASSVQTARMAFHAIRSGEGHAFVSAGVECVSRYRGFGSAGVDPVDTHNPVFATAEQRSLDTALSNQTWRDPREDAVLPDIYIAMGQTAENVATLRGISRAEQDEFGVRSQNLAEKAIANRIFDAEIAPVTLPDGTVVSTDDGPRPGTTMDASVGAQAGVSAQRHGYRRQLLPAQ